MRSGRARIILAFLAVLVMFLVSVGWVLARSVRQHAASALDDRLTREAQALALGGRLVLDDPRAPASLAEIAREAISPGVEAVVVRKDGSTIVVSSPNGPVRVQDAPEVVAAMGGRTGRAVRPDPITGEDRLYVAVPVPRDGAVLGVVRVSAPTAEIDAAGRRVLLPLAIGGGAAAAAAIILTLAIFIPWMASLKRLAGVVQSVEKGSFSERVDWAVIPEAEDLAAAINHMAESLERQVAASYRERDTFGVVLRTMADALVLVDGQSVVMLMNPAAMELFRADPGSSVGKTLVEVVRDYEIVQVCKRALATGRRHTAEVEYSAQQRILRVAATPLEEKNRAGVLLIVQDMTDVQRMQAMRKEFVANVSHELRTPLASMRAAVEALEAGAIDDRDLARDFLGRIKLEVDAQAETVERLLELSRLETGKTQLTLGPVDIGQVLGEAIDRLRPLAEQRGLAIAVDVPSTLPQVMGDRPSVSEVLINLLGNAIKFTPQGSITVSASVDGGQVEIVVADTGVGISEADLPHVFERFYKADRSRSTEGVGLGLAVAKHLVQAQGGRIWAESKLGKGSAFHVAFPRAEDSR